MNMEPTQTIDVNPIIIQGDLCAPECDHGKVVCTLFNLPLRRFVDKKNGNGRLGETEFAFEKSIFRFVEV